ncbi:MAG: PIG-L deacetylase family protein [Planctomycetota bacterium]
MVRVLAVTAHPDDESFTFGGALALHARRGDAVRLLCLTDGQAGRTGDLVEPAELGAWRREELQRACAVLGIGEPVQPALPDGGLDAIPDDEGAAIVAATVRDFRPNVILTFGPEGASGHPDHIAAWRWSNRARGTASLYAASFPDVERAHAPREPDPPLPATTWIDLWELGDLKRRAFLEHKSQLDHLELFDRLMTALDGKEMYHRVHPAWREGAPHESKLLPGL